MLPRPFAIPAAALDCVSAYRRRIAAAAVDRAMRELLADASHIQHVRFDRRDGRWHVETKHVEAEGGDLSLVLGCTWFDLERT